MKSSSSEEDDEEESEYYDDHSEEHSNQPHSEEDEDLSIEMVEYDPALGGQVAQGQGCQPRDGSNEIPSEPESEEAANPKGKSSGE